MATALLVARAGPPPAPEPTPTTAGPATTPTTAAGSTVVPPYYGTPVQEVSAVARSAAPAPWLALAVAAALLAALA